MFTIELSKWVKEPRVGNFFVPPTQKKTGDGNTTLPTNSVHKRETRKVDKGAFVGRTCEKRETSEVDVKVLF